MRFFLVGTLLLPLITLSCTSFHTTTLGRLDTDSLFVECFGGKAKGIPVKMKVPSHVTVTVYEQQVLIHGVEGIKLQSFNPPQYEVKTDLAYTDKVFLVDFVRPAGGSLDLLSSDDNKSGIEFDDEQYFKSVQAKVREQTMEQVSGALDKIADIPGSFVKKPKVAGEETAAQILDPETGLKNVRFEKSVIAYQRFDLARPHWEDEMNCFVAKYLKKCGTCPGSETAGQGLMFPGQAAVGFRPELLPLLEQ
ncbi:hypothetical protein [Gimesia algae]|uniref:DUF4369 domain-containing protein n=1 Tax=Gimesia algae TaxID=2527971 RepID=A0A517VH55_9PLAN|nr:hypothetical protein [Gimesia algae]QDT92342.1 hypothetical protein Pan161_40090 [Gimesia algae]